ncbi:T-lymphocyte activation antigen CD86-like isoform X2 [Genypterus blacodes]|uniref:T-lymphocyte activation antigen CD86-like isoform X2 n=1 Tax=Genypterus blacodes TaxID=154954 RepID=UPI003F75B2FD
MAVRRYKRNSILTGSGLHIFRLLCLPLLVGGGAAQIELTGEVGGTVTVPCPVVQHELEYLYFQKGTSFVNGYHSRGIKSFRRQKDTVYHHEEKTVEMQNLKVSDGGDYQCIFQYKDRTVAYKSMVRLSITANYSKPTLWVSSDCSSRCKVTCSSHGGYPSRKVQWNLAGNASSQWRHHVNESQDNNQETSLFNTSSTAFFNCSDYKMQSLSCTVGGFTSETKTICETKKSYPIAWIISGIAGCVFVFVILGIILCKCKKSSKKGKAVATTEPGWVLSLSDQPQTHACCHITAFGSSLDKHA